MVFACGINYWMSSWKLTRADVVDNRNLPWMQTCFEQNKFKNWNFVICIITSSHLPSIVKITHVHQLLWWNHEENLILNHWFWTTNIIMNTTHWRNDDICYMTICTYVLKWKCNKANYGQHLNHLKKKNSNKKVNEDEHKHRENVEKR